MSLPNLMTLVTVISDTTTAPHKNDEGDVDNPAMPQCVSHDPNKYKLDNKVGVSPMILFDMTVEHWATPPLLGTSVAAIGTTAPHGNTNNDARLLIKGSLLRRSYGLCARVYLCQGAPIRSSLAPLWCTHALASLRPQWCSQTPLVHSSWPPLSTQYYVDCFDFQRFDCCVIWFPSPPTPSVIFKTDGTLVQRVLTPC